jgi:alpha-tubulin suppressor-like RCC1 family protein
MTWHPSARLPVTACLVVTVLWLLAANAAVAANVCTNVVEVSAGRAHTCVVLQGGSAKCWGYNGNGQLGDATTSGRLLPVAVSGLNNVLSITAGGNHTCVANKDTSGTC